MRILLVDDHTMFRMGLVMQLQLLRPEAQAVQCDSPQAARAHFDGLQPPFDVIVLDLGMPGFQRLEALSYFRGLCPEIPCVVVSGAEDPQLVRDCVEMGAFGFQLEAHKWINLQVRLREFMPVGVRPLVLPIT